MQLKPLTKTSFRGCVVEDNIIDPYYYFSDGGDSIGPPQYRIDIIRSSLIESRKASEY